MNEQEKMFNEYALELKALPGVTATHSENSHKETWDFKSSTPDALEVAVYLWKQGSYFVGIDVKGVDCDYWHTSEEETLDYHIELAKAALLGHVGYNRSPIMKYKEVCFMLDGKWECTRTDKAGLFHYVTTRKKIMSPKT